MSYVTRSGRRVPGALCGGGRLANATFQLEPNPAQERKQRHEPGPHRPPLPATVSAPHSIHRSLSFPSLMLDLPVLVVSC